MYQVKTANWSFQRNIAESLPWTPNHFLPPSGIHTTAYILPYWDDTMERSALYTAPSLQPKERWSI
jgi:hypothetical protein